MKSLFHSYGLILGSSLALVSIIDPVVGNTEIINFKVPPISNQHGDAGIEVLPERFWASAASINSSITWLPFDKSRDDTTNYTLHLEAKSLDYRAAAPKPSYALFLIDLTTQMEHGSMFGKLWMKWERHWIVGNGKEMRTIKLCWPATMPADFTLRLYQSRPPSISNISASGWTCSTPPVMHQHYLLVKATSTAIAISGTPYASLLTVPVRFTLAYEPLFLRCIPRSTLPIVGLLAGLWFACWLGNVGGRVADLVLWYADVEWRALDRQTDEVVLQSVRGKSLTSNARRTPKGHKKRE